MFWDVYKPLILLLNVMGWGIIKGFKDSRVRGVSDSAISVRDKYDLFGFGNLMIHEGEKLSKTRLL